MATFQAQYTVPSNGTQVTVLSGEAINSNQVNIRNTGTNTVLLGPPLFQGPPANFAVTTAQTGGTFATGVVEYWKITTLNAQGESLPSSPITTTFSYPTSTAVATLTWTAVSGATGYKIYRSADPPVWTTGSLLVTTIGSGATTTYTDTGAAPGAGLPPTSSTSTLPVLFPLGANEYLGTQIEPDDLLIAQVQTTGTAGQITILGMG